MGFLETPPGVSSKVRQWMGLQGLMSIPICPACQPTALATGCKEVKGDLEARRERQYEFGAGNSESPLTQSSG